MKKFWISVWSSKVPNRENESLCDLKNLKVPGSSFLLSYEFGIADVWPRGRVPPRKCVPFLDITFSLSLHAFCILQLWSVIWLCHAEDFTLRCVRVVRSKRRLLLFQDPDGRAEALPWVRVPTKLCDHRSGPFYVRTDGGPETFRRRFDALWANNRPIVYELFSVS